MTQGIVLARIPWRQTNFHPAKFHKIIDISIQMLLWPSTLDYLINMQDVEIMQAWKIPKINKREGCNKAMQVGIFPKINSKKSSLLEIKLVTLVHGVLNIPMQ